MARVSLRGGPEPPPDPGSRAGQIQPLRAAPGSRGRWAQGLRIPESRGARPTRPWRRVCAGTRVRGPQQPSVWRRGGARGGRGVAGALSRSLKGRLRTRAPPTSHRAVAEATAPADSAALRPVCTSASAVTWLLQPAHVGVRLRVRATSPDSAPAVGGPDAGPADPLTVFQPGLDPQPSYVAGGSVQWCSRVS